MRRMTFFDEMLWFDQTKNRIWGSCVIPGTCSDIRKVLPVLTAGFHAFVALLCADLTSTVRALYMYEYCASTITGAHISTICRESLTLKEMKPNPRGHITARVPTRVRILSPALSKSGLPKERSSKPVLVLSRQELLFDRNRLLETSVGNTSPHRAVIRSCIL